MVIVRRLKKKTVGVWFEKNQTQKFDWFWLVLLLFEKGHRRKLVEPLVLLLFEKGDRKKCGTIIVAARCCSKKTKKNPYFDLQPNSEISVFLSNSN